METAIFTEPKYLRIGDRVQIVRCHYYVNGPGVAVFTDKGTIECVSPRMNKDEIQFLVRLDNGECRLITSHKENNEYVSNNSHGLSRKFINQLVEVNDNTTSTDL